MRKILGILFIFILFNGVTACTKEVAEKDDIQKFVKDYCAVRYNVKDPTNPPTPDEIASKVKEYVSKEEYEKQIANRYYSFPAMVAKETKKSIEVQDLSLEDQSKNEDGTIDYTYLVKIKLYDEKQSKVYEKEGELTISTSDQERKITRDFSRGTKIDGLEDGGL